MLTLVKRKQTVLVFVAVFTPDIPSLVFTLVICPPPLLGFAVRPPPSLLPSLSSRVLFPCDPNSSCMTNVYVFLY